MSTRSTRPRADVRTGSLNLASRADWSILRLITLFSLAMTDKDERARSWVLIPCFLKSTRCTVALLDGTSTPLARIINVSLSRCSKRFARRSTPSWPIATIAAGLPIPLNPISSGDRITSLMEGPLSTVMLYSFFCVTLSPAVSPTQYVTGRYNSLPGITKDDYLLPA